jgi:chromosome partitioning protein
VDPRDVPGVYDALLGERAAAECVVAAPEGFTVMPASPELAGAEVELVPEMAREHRLARTIAPLLPAYDWILVDCPPSLGLLTVNALTAAQSVIIPVQCEYMALEGLSRLMETLELVRRNLNPGLAVLGLVLTMFDPRTRLAQGVVDEVRAHFPDTVFETVVPRSVRLSEAPSYGQSIFSYEPGGRAALAYEALAGEILARAGVESTAAMEARP